MTRKSWRRLWRRTKLERETEEGVENIIQQNHIQGTAFVQRLACGGAAVIQVRFHYKFSFFPKEGTRIHPYSIRSYGQKASIIVTLAKHTDHPDWS